MNIFEIIGAKPIPGIWLDRNRAIFEYFNVKFGIYITFSDIVILNKTYRVANIAFGTYENNFEIEEDLSLKFTGIGNARIIFSTVATACINNTYLTNSDIIVMIGNDEEKERRSLLYSAAANELIHKIPYFREYKISYSTNPDGDLFVSISKVKLSDEELQILGDNFQIKKLKRIPRAS
jgi:hypothetical protein